MNTGLRFEDSTKEAANKMIEHVGRETPLKLYIIYDRRIIYVDRIVYMLSLNVFEKRKYLEEF